MILRFPHDKDNPYFLVNRTACNDERLGMKALGLHTYLLSKPDGWKANIKQLSKRFGCGSHAIRSAFRELREAGYTSDAYVRDKLGKISEKELAIHEFPIVQETSTMDNLNHGESLDIVSSVKAVITEETPTPRRQAEIYTLYEQNLGLLTPILAEKIGDAIDTYPNDWIPLAIEIAVEQNKRKWTYVEGILRRCKAEGVSPQPLRLRATKHDPKDIDLTMMLQGAIT